jgi:hypothetical protein
MKHGGDRTSEQDLNLGLGQVSVAEAAEKMNVSPATSLLHRAAEATGSTRSPSHADIPSVDASRWEILRTFSLDTDLPIRVGFESQSPAGEGAIASFSSITYTPRRIENIYK